MISSSVRFVYDGSAGRWQYVIGKGSNEKKYVLEQVEFLADLGKIKDRDHLVLVRKAYLDDPTVDHGWATYYYDAETKQWLKFSEEESMDADTTIPDDLFDDYAKIDYVDEHDDALDAKIKAIDTRVTKVENYLKDCDAAVNKLAASIG